eukprot:1138838-Pelagomonas_calceolata.AAC.9
MWSLGTYAFWCLLRKDDTTFLPHPQGRIETLEDEAEAKEAAAKGKGRGPRASKAPGAAKDKDVRHGAASADELPVRKRGGAADQVRGACVNTVSKLWRCARHVKEVEGKPGHFGGKGSAAWFCERFETWSSKCRLLQTSTGCCGGQEGRRHCQQGASIFGNLSGVRAVVLCSCLCHKGHNLCPPKALRWYYCWKAMLSHDPLVQVGIGSRPRVE